MAYVQNVRKRIQITVPRLDGGLNQKDGPQAIDVTESPDCLNVVFGDKGSVEARQGTSYVTTAVTGVGTNAADGLASYKQTMVAWFGGTMNRLSGTAWVPVSLTTGQFTSGVNVSWAIYQNILFCSDGTTGPWRWEGSDSFYKMGMYPMSAPSGANSASAGNIAASTWYYAVSPVNTHLSEGPLGSSVAVTNTGSATIAVTGIAVGTALAGIFKRYVYRASSTTGPWYRVYDLGDNVATSFTDTVGAASAIVSPEAPDATSSPKPFSCITLHKERFWMPDADNESLLRYTEFTDPFISDDLNFVEAAEGDGSDILALGVQNDLVTAFKDNSIFVADMVDPSDDTTIQIKKSPANFGIVSGKALANVDNGIVFVAKQFGKAIGIGYLSGLDLVQSQDQYLLNRMLTNKIETLFTRHPTSLYSDICMGVNEQVVYIGVATETNSTRIDGLLWFDITRIVRDANTDPGSWSLWTGYVGCKSFVNHVGSFYGAYSVANGHIIEFNNGTYTDADGSAIDAYWWSKELGGEGDMDSWIKDFRFVTPWYELLGSYNMNMTVRVDGDQGTGNTYQIDLTPPGTLWNGSTWNGGIWNGGQIRKEREYPVGTLLGKRIQVRFDNDNTAGQGFKVHQFKVTYNPRRQR